MNILYFLLAFSLYSFILLSSLQFMNISKKNQKEREISKDRGSISFMGVVFLFLLSLLIMNYFLELKINIHNP